MGNNAELVQGVIRWVHRDGNRPQDSLFPLWHLVADHSFGFFTPCVAASRITNSPVAVLTASNITSHTPSVATISILTVGGVTLNYGNHTELRANYQIACPTRVSRSEGKSEQCVKSQS